jgi:hypothetical protein
MIEIASEEVSERLVIESFNNIIEGVPDEMLLHFDKLLKSSDKQLKNSDVDNNNNKFDNNNRLQNFTSFFFYFNYAVMFWMVRNYF